MGQSQSRPRTPVPSEILRRTDEASARKPQARPSPTSGNGDERDGSSDAENEMESYALAELAAIEELTSRLSELHLTPPILSLPSELRLMIYEEGLDYQLKFNFHRFDSTSDPGSLHHGPPTFILVEKVLVCPLLQTCQQIHGEATKYIQRAAFDHPAQLLCRCPADPSYASQSSLRLTGRLIADMREDMLLHGRKRKWHYGPTYRLRKAALGKAFLDHAYAAIRNGKMLEVAIYVEPRDTEIMRSFVTYELQSLIGYMIDDAQFVYRFRDDRPPKPVPTGRFNFEVVVAVQGMDVTHCGAEFLELLEAARRVGVHIHGVAGITPAVDWAGHWGMADLGALEWTWDAMERDSKKYRPRGFKPVLEAPFGC